MTKTQLLGAFALFATLAAPVLAKVPGLPIANDGSKLGECIQMGKWTTQGPTKVYAKAGDRTTVVATLPARSVVTGQESRLLTTSLGMVKMPTPHPVYDADHNVVGTLKKGDVAQVVYYEGEGYYQVIFQDRLLDAELTDLQNGSSSLKGGTDPKIEWWVKVKTKTGQVGWVNADESPMKGMDKCANGGHPD
jgi:hypothetical protein